MEEPVILLDLWESSFAMCVRIAMEEKGIDYESKQEDLFDKSRLLLKMNPIHKKKYQFWFTMEDPLVNRSSFSSTWMKFGIRKHLCFPVILISDHRPGSGLTTLIKRYMRWGEGYVWRRKTRRKQEFIACLKTLEGELGNKVYFRGESFGLVDVVLLPYTSWFYIYETFGNFKIEEKCP